MAPTYPLTMPTEIMAATDFQIVAVTTSNKLRSGKGFGTEIAPYFWRCSMETEILTIRDHGRWDAFFDALRGDTKSCLLYDTARLVPKAYTTLDGLTKFGGGSFASGQATASSFSSPRAVNCTALPLNFQLLCGDYVGFVKSGRYSLHRIVEDAVTDMFGQATLYFEPPVSDHFLTGSTAVFNRPKGEFILDVNSQVRGRKSDRTPVSFKATSRAV